MNKLNIEFQVSLYFDLLGALFTSTRREDFLNSSSENSYNKIHFHPQHAQLRLSAR